MTTRTEGDAVDGVLDRAVDVAVDGARDGAAQVATRGVAGGPTWWAGRRFGVRFDLSLAVVPAWAPSGADGSRYVELLEGPTDVVAPEVVAHHRDRWGHVASYDDFAELLDFGRFDAAEWADLAVEAGASFAVVVVDGPDGWRWWPSPSSDRRLTDRGRRLDVAGELAGALRARGLEVGIETGGGPDRGTIGDTGGRAVSAGSPSGGAEVAAALDHLGARFVWRRGHTSIDVGGSGDDLVTVVDHLPAGVVPTPWTIVRPVGRGGGPNRGRRADHHLTGVEIVDLFAETIAKGGALIVDVSPQSDGTIPVEQSEPLVDAGSWIRRHAGVLDRAIPRDDWGDRDVRVLELTPAADDGDDGVRGSGDGDGDDDGAPASHRTRELAVIDVTRHGRVGSMPRSALPVASVELVLGAGDRAADLRADTSTVTWTQDESGLAIDRRPPPVEFTGDRIGVDVYRLVLDDVVEADALFPTTDDEPIPLAPILVTATPGQIVRLGEATYLGPAAVPDGVTVRGLGPERTIVVPDPHASTEGRPTLVLGHRSRAEHLSVAGARPDGGTTAPAHACRIGGDRADLLGCRIVGRVAVTGGAVSLRAVAADGIDVSGGDDVSISRCELDGAPSEAGIRVVEAARPIIDSCRADGHRTGVELIDVESGNVRGCSIESGWAAISLLRCDQTHVHANRIARSVRAVDVVAGTDAVIDGNWVVDGDSGCVIRSGAAGATVVGNRWERCRVGLFVWEVDEFVHRDNHSRDLDEDDAELVVGP